MKIVVNDDGEIEQTEPLKNYLDGVGSLGWDLRDVQVTFYHPDDGEIGITFFTCGELMPSAGRALTGFLYRPSMEKLLAMSVETRGQTFPFSIIERGDHFVEREAGEFTLYRLFFHRPSEDHEDQD